MAKTTLQLRRGTQSENAGFTGALGEVTVDTTRKTLVVHDGSTAGGSALAKLDSPAFTGTPTAPTQTAGNNTTRIATTAFVQTALSSFVPTIPNTDSVSEGSTNLYFTTPRARSAISVSGSLTYVGGVISYTQPTGLSAFANDVGYLTSASIRTEISATGDISYDSGTGIISYTQAVDSVNGLTGAITLNTDDIAEDGSPVNLWFTQARARGSLSAGTGITYSSISGAISLTNTSITLNSKVISLTSGASQTVTTDDITQGSTNLYASATNVRAALSAGTGVSFVSGQISIGQAVGTSSSVTFGGLTVNGDVNLDSDTFKVNSTLNRVGINTATPSYDLDVTGDINFTGKLRIGSSAGVSGYVLSSGGTSTSPSWQPISNVLPNVTELDNLADNGLSTTNTTTCTVTSASTNRITCTSTAVLELGMPVQFTGINLLGGLSKGVIYFVKSIVDGNNFTVSAFKHGDTLSLTNSSGSMTVSESLPKIDGGTTEFRPTNNQATVSITAPIQVLITKNGLQLTPWLNTTGPVWLSGFSFGDYTVNAGGKIVFTSPPKTTDTITARVLVGNVANTITKKYPFRAIDVMTGY